MHPDPHNSPVPPPTHEERAVLAAMRSRWEAMFRGAVDDVELDRVLRYLETPVSTFGHDASIEAADGEPGPAGSDAGPTEH